MNQKKFEKRLIIALSKKPHVKRYMTQMIKAMGFNVKGFKSLPAKMYASLMALEAQVLKNQPIPDAQKAKLIMNGKVDVQTDATLEKMIVKNRIEIPEELLEYSGLNQALIGIGANEVHSVMRKRRMAGKEPLTTYLIGGGINDSLAQALVERRNWILNQSDDQQYFLKKFRENREKRQEFRRENGGILTRFLDAKNERKVERIEARGDKQVNRIFAKSDGKVNVINAKSQEGFTQGGGGANIINALGESGVLAQVGGTLQGIFGNGGAVPQLSENNPFSTNSGMGGIIAGAGNSTNPEDGGLFENGLGFAEVAVLGLGALGIFIGVKLIS